MALEFTAMIRIFIEGSKGHIVTKLEEFFHGLDKIRNPDDYEARHRSFCEWFTQNVPAAEKKLKNARVQPREPSSYGQAAKVLDIAIKVYVYYCGTTNSRSCRADSTSVARRDRHANLGVPKEVQVR